MPANWTLYDSHLIPQRLRFKETLFTIGNGMFCTRGAFEESYPGDNPATFVHGLFDDVPTYRSELVNLPNWLSMQIFINGEPFRLDRGEVLAYERSLNLYNGCLARQVLWRSPDGHTLELKWERFISLADRHSMGIRLQVRSIDFNGLVDCYGSLDGLVDNAGIRHWDFLSQGELGMTGGFLHLRTKTTKLEICQAFTMCVEGENLYRFEREDAPWTPGVRIKTPLSTDQVLVFEKMACLFTDQDSSNGGIDQFTEDKLQVDLRLKATEKLKALENLGYTDLRQESVSSWEKEWDDCTVAIEGDDAAELAVRFSLFHLLIAVPRHSTKCSIGSRALSGFRYHGHVFWETEIYMLPFFLFTRPDLARNLLLYRYHTLPGACVNAHEKGMEGSRFAWESAASGEEITPRWVPGPNRLDLERIWSGDLEQYVTATIVYAVNQYWQVTGDDPFLRDYGAEVIFNAANFWEGRVAWDISDKQYKINDVFGPDEFHLHVNNNAFTNQVVCHSFKIAIRVWDWLCKHVPDKAADLKKRLGLTPARLEKWQHISDNIPLCIDPQTGLIEQFDGFFNLEEINLADYEPRLQSMGVILDSKDQQLKVVRQPDVLMLLYLFKNLVDLPVQKSNWEYYTPRTDLSHGSSLGYSIQAALAARLGEVKQAYRDFMAATAIDLDDTYGNTADGIHAGNAGGIWQAIVFGFAGLEISNANGVDNFTLHPCLPSHWKRLSFSFYLGGKRHIVDLVNPMVSEIPQSTVPVAKTRSTSPLAENLSLPFPTTENQVNANSFLDSLPGMGYRCLADDHRTMLRVDRSCFNLTGFHPVDLIQNNVISYKDLIHPHDREYVCSEVRTALREKRSFWLAYRIVTTSKGEQWVWEYGQGLPVNEAGQVVIEGRVIELAGRNPKYEALFEYAERLEGLREIDLAILTTQSVTDVIHIALRTLKRLLPDTNFCLILLDLHLEQAEMFNLASGGQEINWKALQFSPELKHRWFTSDSVFGNEMLDAKDVSVLEWMETQVIEVFGELGTNHRLIPLRSRGELVGLLALRSENPDTFAQSRFGIVSEVVNSLTIVIIQRRLLEQVRSVNQSLQNLSQYLVNIQEQERRSIARELHDEIGQALTAVKMSLESLDKLPVAASRSRLQESIHIVSQTLQQVRNMSLNLRPALLDELGLSATLRWYVDRLAQWNNIDAQFQASLSQERMPPEIETTLFRVAQEALTNAIRHAEANRVAVVLTQTDEYITLQIRDNGRGFSVEKAIHNAVRGASLGLLSMQERLHLVGGKLNIHSTPGLGTEIAAKVPLSIWMTQNAMEEDHGH